MVMSLKIFIQLHLLKSHIQIKLRKIPVISCMFLSQLVLGVSLQLLPTSNLCGPVVVHWTQNWGSNNRYCSWEKFQVKFHLISPSCPQLKSALIVQNCALKHQHFISCFISRHILMSLRFLNCYEGIHPTGGTRYLFDNINCFNSF